MNTRSSVDGFQFPGKKKRNNNSHVHRGFLLRDGNFEVFIESWHEKNSRNEGRFSIYHIRNFQFSASICTYVEKNDYVRGDPKANFGVNMY